MPDRLLREMLLPCPIADAVPTGEDVALAGATFADGQARFYRYVTATGRETRFFIVKSRDGAVHAGLDACDCSYF